MIRSIKTALIIVLLTSCGVDKVDKNKIAGRYIFTPWDSDTIDINSDGTYRHYMVTNRKRIVNSGTWTLNSLETEVHFKDFSFNSDSISSGNWFSRLRLQGEEIRLMYADEVPAYYYKISEFDSLK
jgi:hypothetical protein